MEALAHVTDGEEPTTRREAQLVSAVLRKDRKATAEFVSLCSDWVYPFVRYRLFPRTDVVEDLMQEVLISAWKNLSTFRADAGLRAWVLGIARHKVEDYYRKRIREAELEDEDTDAREATEVSYIRERLEAAEDHKRVHLTLAQLPEVYRLVLIWRYRDEYSLREMAQLTGKTEKAMERLLARARESFRKRWSDDQP